ncbi:MAG: hypothetical protein A2017_00410 [Lentisphaerae bacterium GWF2_44_16]|nr:MAG: hypothetical protein A2017_00410 [Lentisphaerae bacterium GWF2_44_16]
MNTYSIIIFASLLVIFSYIFEIIARKTRIPSVFFLLLMGIFLRYMAETFKVAGNIDFSLVLPVIGIVGLVLIVLEGALDLEINREKTGILKRSFFSSVITLIFTATLIALIFHAGLKIAFDRAFLNALPFAVISSAMAIPSVGSLSTEKKEFIVYESAFSDILGIMIFSYVLDICLAGKISLFGFVLSITLTFITGFFSVIFLFYLLMKIKHHIKIYLIMAILFLLFSVSKLLHFSSLLTVFMFGILLVNIKYFLDKTRFLSQITESKVELERERLKSITYESAFLVRTFFFIIFGFSINISTLFNFLTLSFGIIITIVILMVRYLHLRFWSRSNVFPELFLAPRGLVTVLLFYSIPSGFLIPGITEDVLFVVIIISSILMAISLFFYKESTVNKIEI